MNTYSDVAYWLRAIAYGIIPGTPQQRSVAGYFLTELFDSLNYRIPPADGVA